MRSTGGQGWEAAAAIDENGNSLALFPCRAKTTLALSAPHCRDFSYAKGRNRCQMGGFNALYSAVSVGQLASLLHFQCSVFG